MPGMKKTESYPGLQFTPPPGTIDDGAEEGEAMVKWKKVGDSYTITEFDGKEIGGGEPDSDEEPTVNDEIDQAAGMQ